MWLGSQVLFRKDFVIVVKSYNTGGYYFTIVNTRKNTHCHVFRDQFNAAKMICVRAAKNEIPQDYPSWMKNSIRRIL